MSIKFAVLGLLRERPMHGYAVCTAFDEQIGDFWNLNYGQVYPVLVDLEREGLISGHDEQAGKRPRRRVFSISPMGREAFRAWLAKPSGGLRPFRDEFYVRLLFAESDTNLLGTLLHEQLVRTQERLAALIAERDAYKASGQASRVRVLFAEASILHAEADLKALRRCEAALLSAPATSIAARVAQQSERRTKSAARA
jgi:DNA-binding PadR family transcriptional regulator